MKEMEYSVRYQQTTLETLSSEYRVLIEHAVDATKTAYAPYSKFDVGASVMLEDGTILKGSNKENVAFPAGVCAERNVLNYASDLYPSLDITAMAITASCSFESTIAPVAPCGICRQVLCEVESNQSSTITMLLVSPSGDVLIFQAAKDLLPFHFHIPQLKK